MGRQASKRSRSESAVGEAAKAGTNDRAALAVGPAQRPASNDIQRPDLTPAARTAIAEIRGRLETRVGQLVLMLMNVPRYRHQTIADLNHLILEPLLRDRVAIAHAKAEGADVEARAPAPEAPIGVAIWASVSDEVDAKIKEQVKAGVFPVRIGAGDWVSGDKIWLLDIVAGNRKAASAVLVNFGRIAGDRRVGLHPIVARSVDRKLLHELRK